MSIEPPEGSIVRRRLATESDHRSLERLGARLRRVSPDTWALLAVAAAVVLANLPYLLGLFESNPLGPRSGLLRAVTAGLVRGQPTIDPNNGFTAQALSHRAALDLVHLRLPWWNPYEGTGAPLAGEMQSAALFPPTLLTLLSNGQLYEHMLLELLAGASTYVLLRRLSVNRWAAVAAGIAFALNGTFAWFSHATVNPVAFLPLLLLGIELAYRATVEDRRGGWWLIALAGALSVYAGFPEVAYIDALFGVFWFAWRCGCVRRERLRALAGKAAVGALVGALLAAPLLIATIDYFNHADLGMHGGTLSGTVHLPTQALPQLLLPYLFGPIFGFSDPKLVLFATWDNVGGYLTASLLLFGLIGLLLSNGRQWLRLTLLLWIVLAVARMYDAPHLLGNVLGVLPGMSRVVFARYATTSVELAVIVLAALGLDHVAGAAGPRRRVVWVGVASLATVAVAALAARPLAHELGPVFNGQRPYFQVAVTWGALVVLAGLGVAVLVRNARARAVLLALLVAGDAVVMFATPELAAPRSVQTDLAPVLYLQRHLGSSRFFTLGPLQPNYGSYFGVGSLNINDVPIPKPYAHYVNANLDAVVDPTLFVGNLGGARNVFAPSPQQELLRNLNGYREAGVAYVLTPVAQTLPQSPSTFTLVDRTPSTLIYRLAGAAPYFTATNPGCSVTAHGRGSATVSCPGATTLIRRETDLPGWSASVDGHSVPVHRANGLFQAVNVPAGLHRVTFGYLPPNIGWGLAAFAAGCSSLLIAGLARRPQAT